MTFDQAVKLVKQERAYQDKKWGSLDVKVQTVEGYLLILESELNEAKEGWMKNKIGGRDNVYSEIIQIAAVAMACIEQHGMKELGALCQCSSNANVNADCTKCGRSKV